MTEPKRWSSPSSEVDPVLRSVLRYGRSLEPNSQQLQAILRGSERRHRTPQRRRLLAFVVAGAAAACAGVAWAGYAGGVLFHSTPPSPSLATPSATPPAAARAQARGAASTAPRATEPAATRDVDSASPAEPRSEQAAAPPIVVDSPTAPRVAPSTAQVPSASPEQDAALLQQARRLVTSEPARALTLTRDHELHFPSSPLAEERQALRIEALARLGRRSEATRDLSAFDQHFPHSIYRHRLHALLPE